MEHTVTPAGRWFRRAADFLFGYDYFISYAHADGHGYARRLYEQLGDLGFSVFLDSQVYVAGDDLRSATRRRIRMSNKLVVIVRPKALTSEWVLREIELCMEAGRMPIAIDVGQTLALADDANPTKVLLKDKIYISDPGAAMPDEPSSDVAGKLARSFDATRQETTRIRVLSFAALGFALVAAVAVWQFMAASENARQARENAQQASQNEQRANQNAQEARNNAIRFYDFCSSAREQVRIGHGKLENLGQNTRFGQLVSRIAQDVAQLPEADDIDCGERPSPAPPGVSG